MDKKKIYQMFILGTGNLDEALKNGLGGVIFFSKDIDTEEHLRHLEDDILAKDLIYPFLSIDEEGGRVERTEYIHPKHLSAKFAYEKGEEYLKWQTKDIAQELKDLNLNLNFAPCADVNTNPDNPIIGERAFSNNPEEVINGVKIVSDIYKEYGIIPCIKHYPGHGDANADSHKTLPDITLSMTDMEQYHIKPFKAAIENGIDMIMAAHLHCTCFDSDPIPTSLSQNAIGYLRNVLKYKGVVITDDMVMQGVQAFGSLEACEMAIRAGVDMFIFRDVNAGVLDMIDSLAGRVESDAGLRNAVLESDLRIEKLKKERLK